MLNAKLFFNRTWWTLSPKSKLAALLAKDSWRLHSRIIFLWHLQDSHFLTAAYRLAKVKELTEFLKSDGQVVEQDFLSILLRNRNRSKHHLALLEYTQKSVDGLQACFDAQKTFVEEALTYLSSDSEDLTLKLFPYSMSDKHTLQALQDLGFVLDFEEVQLPNCLTRLSANWSVQTLLDYQEQTTQ